MTPTKKIKDLEFCKFEGPSPLVFLGVWGFSSVVHVENFSTKKPAFVIKILPFCKVNEIQSQYVIVKYPFAG